MSRPSGEVKVDKKRIDQGEAVFGRNIILVIGERFGKPIFFVELDLLSLKIWETTSFLSRRIINKFDKSRDLASQHLVEQPFTGSLCNIPVNKWLKE